MNSGESMKKLEEMTLREKVGQLLMVGFQADDVEGIKELIDKYHVGNIILFTRNITDLKTVFEINQTLQRYAMEKNGYPLFISIDQEGGMVTRIRREATFFPGNMTVAATGNTDYAYQIGKMMGQELFHLGINMNLAPVLDVNNNPHNPVIGVRSYSDSPEVVAKFGTAYVRGLQEAGVIATGKHFPGHGDTSVDSHLDLTSVPHDKKRLQEVELYPFKQAIKSGIDAIMSAHVLFPAYEPERLPGTLSQNVLTHLLRDELGFKGLIVTDCLEMKAISDYYTTEKGALMAVRAGANLLCISHTRERQIGAFEEIINAVETNTLDEAIINDRVQRILRKKEEMVEKTLTFLEENFKEASQYFLVPAHQAFAQKVADQALTLVGSKTFTPSDKKTVFVSPSPQATTIADEKMLEGNIIEAVKANFPEWETIELSLNPSDEEIKEVLNTAKDAEQLIVGSYNANIYHQQEKLLEELKSLSIDLHLIALRNPYDVLNKEVNGVCTYEYTPLTIQTVIKYLKGEIQPKGSLPITHKERS